MTFEVTDLRKGSRKDLTNEQIEGRILAARMERDRLRNELSEINRIIDGLDEERLSRRL